MDPRPGLDPAAPEARDWISLQLSLALRPELAARALHERGAIAPALAWLSTRISMPGVDALDAAQARLVARGVRLLPLLDPAYPPQLARLSDPPAMLSIAGDPGCLAGPCVAIVGPRAPSAHGREVARRLAQDLAACGAVVVSGLARGVDAAAHEGALSGGGRTVAVQACGPDRVYPAGHRGLAERIERSGALLTEMPPGTPPRGPFFPLRNRIISALCRAVIVVEARRRSGTLVTARHAMDQGVELLVVPGPVTSPTCRGSNELFREGAAPALDISDVLPHLGLRVPGAAPPAPLEASQQRIVEVLEDEPLSADALARRLSEPVADLAGDLLELELRGRLVRDRDGRLRVL